MAAITRHRWLPPLALALLCLVWGYTWVLAKQALDYASPFAFAAERCLGGALSLLLVLKLLGRPLRLVQPGPTLLIGLVQVGAFMMLQIWALVEGGAGKTAVLIYTMPIWTLLLAWPVLGERIRGPQWLAAGATVGGLLLIIEPWDMHTSLFSKFLGVAAALAWAAGTILVKRLRKRHAVDLLSLTAWQMLLGAAALMLLAAIIPQQPTRWTTSYLGILVFVSVFSTALGWWLWTWILDRLPAWEASLSVLGAPVVALVSSRAVLGEPFTSSEVAGILLIGAGLGLLSLLGWISSRRMPASDASA